MHSPIVFKSMKIDRLLSIIVYLLNRDLVSARELSELFEVSLRTIQRDMETIDRAGIPVVAVQGPAGGYGIMDSYKMDRQFVSTDDLFYIITALTSIGSSLQSRKITATIEKMKSLLPRNGAQVFSERYDKLHIDFSTLGGDSRQQEVFRLLDKAIDGNRLVGFEYTNNKLENTKRIVEPMTIVFKWRAWYLYGYCRLKEDYRLFRLSRIRSPELLSERFRRRALSFETFMDEFGERSIGSMTELTLSFQKEIRSLVEEFYEGEGVEEKKDGSLVVRTRMPEDGWLYGLILSYGPYVEVLKPERIRSAIREMAEQIYAKYQ